MQNQSWFQYTNSFPIISYNQFPQFLTTSPSIQYYAFEVQFNWYDSKNQQPEISDPVKSQYQPPEQESPRESSSEEVEEQHIMQQDEIQEKDKDRNVVSNSLKVFRKYASDSTKANGSIINTIIQRNKLNYSIEQFSKDLDRKIPREKNYLGVKYLKSLLGKKERKTNFTTVIRILLRYYYKKQVYTTVQTSWKILKSAKRKQLIGVRKICQHL